VRIAVAGGTGLLGNHVVDVLRERGHDPVVLSRREGVDLVSGSGLAAALDGAESVIDASNVTAGRAEATAFFEAAASSLQRYGGEAGLRHVVTVSIVGIDRAAGYGYYAAKLAHEAAAASGPVPASIVRSTQFHEFAGLALGFGKKGPVAVVPRMRSQPVAARSVAERLVDVALGDPLPERLQVAGPDVLMVPDMVRRLLRARGTTALVVAVPVPGAGKAMATGALLPDQPYDTLGPSFDQWLEHEATAGRA
jgi:uncharacterized protein YbjT (DUF2867 family)